MIRELIRLKLKVRSHTEISEAIHISRTTLLKYLKRIETSAYNLEELITLDDNQLITLLHNEEQSTTECHQELYSRFKGYRHELHRTGVTLKRLWQEYKQDVPLGLQYSQFC